MAKAMNDAGADAALDYWTDVDLAIACSAQPTTYAEATSTYALADVAVSGSDFTKANGDSSGRKVTMATKTGVTIDASGTPTHTALCKSGDSTLRYVTTATGSALTSGGGNTCSIGGFKIEIADPS